MQIGDYKIVLRADRAADTPALNSTNTVSDPSTPNNLKASRAPTPAMGSRGGLLFLA